MSFEPINTSTLSADERKELIDDGWRVFYLDGEEFIAIRTSRHSPPRIGGRVPGKKKFDRLPRATFSYETSGPSKGQKIDLMAWSHSTTTVQDFEDTGSGLKLPGTIKSIPKVFAYVWTDNGLHIYQHGRQSLLDGHDEQYESISKEQRGWYGDRLQFKDGRGLRELITTSPTMAERWVLAGGKARVVSDLARSYSASKAHKDYFGFGPPLPRKKKGK